jgi:hypothetical protein
LSQGSGCRTWKEQGEFLAQVFYKMGCQLLLLNQAMQVSLPMPTKVTLSFNYKVALNLMVEKLKVFTNAI